MQSPVVQTSLFSSDAPDNIQMSAPYNNCDFICFGNQWFPQESGSESYIVNKCKSK